MPSWADQLLPQLLMEQFDTLLIQCRHIEHMHEGVIIFDCTDSTEIFFSKLRSAGLNYNLPFFSLTLTVRGVSNKNCLLPFFIKLMFWVGKRNFSLRSFFYLPKTYV